MLYIIIQIESILKDADSWLSKVMSLFNFLVGKIMKVILTGQTS